MLRPSIIISVFCHRVFVAVDVAPRSLRDYEPSLHIAIHMCRSPNEYMVRSCSNISPHKCVSLCCAQPLLYAFIKPAVSFAFYRYTPFHHATNHDSDAKLLVSLADVDIIIIAINQMQCVLFVCMAGWSSDVLVRCSEFDMHREMQCAK